MSEVWASILRHLNEAGLAGQLALAAFVLPGLGVALLRWSFGHRVPLAGFVRAAVMLPLVIGLTGWLWQRTGLLEVTTGAADLRVGAAATAILGVVAFLTGVHVRRRVSEGLPSEVEPSHPVATSTGRAS